MNAERSAENDAIVKVLREHMHEGYFETEDGHRECFCGHVFGPTETYRTHLAGALTEALSDQVAAVERAMTWNAAAAWRAAGARAGLSDHEALLQHADAMTRWSERLRMALRGDLTGDEEWLR